MKRRRIKKVRTTISIDEDIFIESGDYIYNLSAFVQECIKREIARQKAKEDKQLRITTIMKSKSDTDYSISPEFSQQQYNEILMKLK